MKKTLFIATLLSGMFAYAQIPDGLSYQAALNSNDIAFANRQVAVTFSILKGSATGGVAYSERHSATTDRQGRVELEIGHGTPLTGRFDTIDWLSGSHYLKAEFSTDGGNSTEITATQQLISVPYAFAAKSAHTTVRWANTTPNYENDIRRVDSLLLLYNANLANLDSIVRGMTAPPSPAPGHTADTGVKTSVNDSPKGEAILKNEKGQ